MLSFQEKQSLAHSPELPKFIEFLSECKTQLPTLIGKNEFETLVNTVTMERESELVFKFGQTLKDIKAGIIYE